MYNKMDNKMDKINIKNLVVYAKHGVLPDEKENIQKFIISASLSLNLRKAGLCDDLQETIDYAKITTDIKKYIELTSYNLIEALAEGLAEKLLIENPALQEIWIEIKKPNAQINANFEYVSVELKRGRHTVYLSLGSNIGDRESNLNFALEEIAKLKECKVKKVSNYYNTKPYGFTEQADFLNSCVEIETLFSPTELIEVIWKIEIKAGRERIVKWGPRTLDIDIVYYDDMISFTKDLMIPHIDLHNREYVLIPLKEIAPNLLHPVLMKNTTQLLETLKQRNL